MGHPVYIQVDTASSREKRRYTSSLKILPDRYSRIPFRKSSISHRGWKRIIRAISIASAWYKIKPGLGWKFNQNPWEIVKVRRGRPAEGPDKSSSRSRDSEDRKFRPVSPRLKFSPGPRGEDGVLLRHGVAENSNSSISHFSLELSGSRWSILHRGRKSGNSLRAGEIPARAAGACRETGGRQGVVWKEVAGNPEFSSKRISNFSRYLWRREIAAYACTGICIFHLSPSFSSPGAFERAIKTERGRKNGDV